MILASLLHLCAYPRPACILSMMYLCAVIHSTKTVCFHYETFRTRKRIRDEHWANIKKESENLIKVRILANSFYCTCTVVYIQADDNLLPWQLKLLLHSVWYNYTVPAKVDNVQKIIITVNEWTFVTKNFPSPTEKKKLCEPSLL